MAITEDELEAIERRLAELSPDERKSFARRLATSARPRPRSDLAADRLLDYLRALRRRTDILPTNREIENLSGLNGEDISYLLKVLRRRGTITIDYPLYGLGDRTFELPW